MNPNEFRSESEVALDMAIAAVLAEPLHEDAAQRVLAYARTLGPVEKKRDPSRRWLVKAVLVCICASLIVLTWRSDKDNAWAQIVRAVAQQPWVVITTNQPQSRCWHSGSLGIIALEVETEQSHAFMFIDLNQQTIDAYSEKGPYFYARRAGAIFRSSIHSGNASDFERVSSQLSAVVTNDVIGMLTPGAEVLQHRATSYKQNGENFVKHHFVLKFNAPAAKARRVTIVVDERSRLPVEQTDEHEDGTKTVMTFSYPDSGPADIHALGVPREAELVDQRPTSKLKEILDQLAHRRIAGEPYCVVAIERLQRQAPPSFLLSSRVWKDGTRWRIERLQKARPQPPFPQDVEPAQFWHRFAEDAKYFLVAISDGRSECTYHAKRNALPPQEDPDNTGFLVVQGYDKTIRPHHNLRDPDTYHRELLPEWVAYPRLNYDDRLAIEVSPHDGHGDVICVKSDSDHMRTRIWLDPARDYAANKIEYSSKQGNDYVLQGYQEISDYFQTPAGRWLPRTVRTVNADQRSSPTITSYYYSFDVRPDEKRFAIMDSLEEATP